MAMDRIEARLSRHDIEAAGDAIELPIWSPDSGTCESQATANGAIGLPTSAVFIPALPPQEPSPFDAAPVFPQLPAESADEIAGFEAATQHYIGALDAADSSESIGAFQRLLGSAVELSHLDELSKRVEEAAAHLDALRAEQTRVHDAWLTERKQGAGRGLALEGLVAELPGRPAELDALAQQISDAEFLLEQWRSLKELATSRFEGLVHEAVAASMPGLSPEEVEFSPYASGVMAQALAAAGETARAKDYYNQASLGAATVAQSAWYRLEALRLEVAEGGKAAAEALPKVRLIRDGLAQLHWDALTARQSGHPKGSDIAETEQPEMPYEPGRPEDVLALDAFSWGVEYDLLQASLAEPDAKEKAIELRIDEIKRLEEDRRLMMSSRIGKADAFEAQIHLNNLQMVVTAWTQTSGAIERAMRSEGAEEAEGLYAQLKLDAIDAKRMARPFVRRERGDRFYEKLATIDWQLRVEGSMSRDLPLDAIRAAANDVVPAFPGSESVEMHLASLRQEAKAAGVEGRLFLADGTINAAIDVSELPEGLGAASRARSAYWLSTSTMREIGLPFAAGTTCSAVALAFSATGVGAALAGGSCALLTGIGNQQYNTRVLGAEATRQASLTGLSRVSELDAHRFRSRWYWNEGFNGLLGTTAMFGKFGLGAGRYLVGGTAALGKTFGQVMSTAASVVDGTRTVGSVMMQGLNATGRGAAALGRGFWRLPTGDKIAVAGSLLWPIDYQFIDEHYNLVWNDGKVDTAIGYAGKAAFWSGLAYRGFALTWRQGAKDVVLKNGKAVEMVGFGKQIADSAWRGGLMRAGMTGALADYYLLDSDYGLLDFAKPVGDENTAEYRDFDRQFAVDNWIGWGGMLLAGGDWAITEFRTFPMYIESFTRIAQARARTAIGAGLVTADFAGDGEMNTWWLGGLGGAMLMNEAGSIALQVDAWGSMVATGFRAGTEWIMQWQQDIPISSPDAKRLMWASAESAVMRFPAKAYMMGNHYMKSFPLGQRMVGWHNWMNAPGRSPFTRLVADGIGPIERMGGKPTIYGWRPNLVAEDKHVSLLLKYGADGAKIEGEPIKLKVLHQKARFIRDTRQKARDIMKRSEFKPTVIEIDGKTYELTSAFKKQSVKALLKNNGYFILEGNLWKMEPWYLGQIRSGGKTMTARQFETLSPKEKPFVEAQLEQEGVLYVKFSDMPEAQVASVKSFLKSEGVYQEGMKGALMKRWYTRPETPVIISAHNKYNGPVESNCVFKIASTPLRDGVTAKLAGGPGNNIIFRLDRELVPQAEATIGGTSNVIFKGPFSKPRLGWSGIWRQASLMTATAVGTNYLIFRRTMDADPDYKMAESGFNYLFSEMVTHPLVQWRFGYDTALAQLLGRGIGIFVHMMGTELFPTYLNTWPGLPMYYRGLDGNPEGTASTLLSKTGLPVLPEPMEPLDTWTNTMSSTQITPMGFWGTAHDTIALFEDRAIKTFRQAEECQRDLLAGMALKASEACQALPLKTSDGISKQYKEWKAQMEKAHLEAIQLLERRAGSLAANFREWIRREEEDDLSVMERRTLVLMAAHMKMTLQQVEKQGPEAAAPYWEWDALRRTYDEVLFSKIPVLESDKEWKDFIADVNRGRAKACDFHYFLKH